MFYFYNRRRQVKNKEGTITKMVRIGNTRFKKAQQESLPLLPSLTSDQLCKNKENSFFRGKVTQFAYFSMQPMKNKFQLKKTIFRQLSHQRSPSYVNLEI